MLALFGFPAAAEEISAGPGEAMALPEGSDARYIEPAGNSYDAQFRRLEQIASQINELGLAAVLGAKLVGETAEAKRIDRSQGDSTMMVVAQQMQDLIDNCLRFHAEYMQEAEPWQQFGESRFHGHQAGAARNPSPVAALHCRHHHSRNTAVAAGSR